MPVKDSAGEVQYVCFTLFDVTDTSIYQTKLKKVMGELEEISNLDGLTRLYNRRYIESTLSQEFSRAQRYNHDLSIILTDIDHFKNVNDTHGHLAGDEVLREVAIRLNDGLRECDIIGRYGGEEFLILLPETNIDGAKILAERLRQMVAEKPIICDGKSIPITISLGLSALSEYSKTYEHLIDEADKALYYSKAAGRNIASIYLRTP